MAKWRRLALEQFPELQLDRHPRCRLYDVSWDVANYLRQAAPQDADGLLNRYLRFAVWCYQQPGLRADAIFAIFEQLWRDVPIPDWEAAMELLEPGIVRDSWMSWDRELSLQELLDIQSAAFKALPGAFSADELVISDRHRPRRRARAGLPRS